MITTTPIGVAIFRNFNPFGRIRSSSTRPVGSANAATSRNPRAIPAIRASSSFSRSSIAAESPIWLPAAMSSAFAAFNAAAFASSADAMASRHAFLSAVVSRASSRDATLACFANCVICSFKFMSC